MEKRNRPVALFADYVLPLALSINLKNEQFIIN